MKNMIKFDNSSQWKTIYKNGLIAVNENWMSKRKKFNFYFNKLNIEKSQISQ